MNVIEAFVSWVEAHPRTGLVLAGLLALAVLLVPGQVSP